MNATRSAPRPGTDRRWNLPLLGAIVLLPAALAGWTGWGTLGLSAIVLLLAVVVNRSRVSPAAMRAIVVAPITSSLRDCYLISRAALRPIPTAGRLPRRCSQRRPPLCAMSTAARSAEAMRWPVSP
jgi:hypothetical protein